jgi:hypothetical protein
LPAANLTGTIADARFPTTLPAKSGINLTALNASNLGSGTVATARLGSGTASSSTFLRGDNSWQVVSVPKLDSPVITGTLSLNDSDSVSHTISNWSDDVSYTITPTNCTVGSVNSSGIFVVTHTSGTPSYTIVATTASLGLDDSTTVTKNILINLTAPTLSSPNNEATATNVVYTVTSTDTNDNKIILDVGSSNFTYQSVSVGSGSKVGNTVEVTGFTTNNPAITIQFTVEADYSVKAKSVDTTSTYGDSDYSATDSLTINNYSLNPLSPYDYGNGRDGDVTSVTVTDTYLTNSPSSGTNSCTVNSTTGFSADDQVLIIQTQKSSLTTGAFEIIEIDGIASSTITFSSNLQNSYSSGSSAVTTQMVKIPLYNSVTLGSTFNVPAWDGNEGGIFICKCEETFALTAQINATGKGFRGGVAASVGYGNGSAQGEGQQNDSSNNTDRNASGGGGGRMNYPGTLSAKSGAGGAHAVVGSNGDSNAVGGASWGGQDLTSHLGFGGAGGAGGYDYSTVGANGANGGGIIIIIAATLTLSGSGELSASGQPGINGVGSGDGGGGAGGSIYIKSGTFTSNNNCNASAGAASEDGGAGSVGRIHVQGTLTGTTSPTAYTG